MLKVGDIVKAKITGFAKFGVFVCLDDGQGALIHISELSDGFVKDVEAIFSIGQLIEAVVISIGDNNKVNLSIKQLNKNKVQKNGPEEYVSNTGKQYTFEEMMSKFKYDSEQKSHDLKKFYESKRGSSNRKR